jgi:hypothetical protein
MWVYNNNTISSLSDLGENEPFGFVYKITNLTNGKFYIGKKNIYSKVNKPITKKELAEWLRELATQQQSLNERK